MALSPGYRVLMLSAIAYGSIQQMDAADTAPVLRAGAAVADITPQKWPVPLVGSFRPREAWRAWDPLSARALVLDDGRTRLGIVIVDSCYCPRDVFDTAKQRASRLTGIPIDHILAAATHTHTAPPSRDRRELKRDPEYVEHVIRGIVSALQQATGNLLPAEIGWGSVQVPEEVFNRRWFMNPGGITPNPFGNITDQVRMNPPRNPKLLSRPAGPTDPEVCFVVVRTANGRPLALLANYALHYVGGVPPGGVSSDYFGAFASQLGRRLFPRGRQDALPHFVGMLSNGTSGDINNINFTNPRGRKKPFERIRSVARLLTDRICAKLSSLTFHAWVPLAMAQSELTVKVRRPTPHQVAQAKQYLAETDETKLPPRAKAYATWTLKLADHPGTESLVLQAVRIGDLGITAIPCEAFAEIGLSLKRKSPLATTFTIELANGHYGYLPTPRQHDLGGYETWLGSNTLEIQASNLIEQRLLELLARVAEPNADSGPR
ncbi:MAG: hypothetical protein ABGZ17_06380 [Planctomycetaceae bacterium]